MLRKKLLPLLVSALGMAGLALLGAYGAASPGQHAVSATQSLLSAAARLVEERLATTGVDLPRHASKLAREPGLGTDMRALSAALSVAAGSAKQNKNLQGRIATTAEKLAQRVSLFREATPQTEAVTLVDALGVVLVSTADRFPRGATLAPTQQSEGDETENAAASAQDKARPAGQGKAQEAAAAQERKAAVQAPEVAPQLWPILQNAFAGTADRGAVVSEGFVQQVAAAPVLLKTNKLVGAVIVERRVRALPQPNGVEIFLVIDGTVEVGQVPAGLDIAQVPSTRDATRLLGSSVVLSRLGGIAFKPHFVDQDRIGLWGKRYAVRQTDRAWGVVLADTTPMYSAIAERQALCYLGGGAAWLLVAIVLVLGGPRGLLQGIDRIADFMSRLTQGVGSERHLNDVKFPPELKRLVRVVNQLVEKFVGGASLRTLPTAPSVDDVIRAQTGDAEAAGTDDGIQFAAIRDGGSLDAASAHGTDGAGGPPPAPHNPETSHVAADQPQDAAAGAAALDEWPAASLEAPAAGPGDEPPVAGSTDAPAGLAAGLFSDLDSPDGASATELPQGTAQPPPPPVAPPAGSPTAELELEDETDPDGEVVAKSTPKPPAAHDGAVAPDRAGADGPVAPSPEVLAAMVKAAKLPPDQDAAEPDAGPTQQAGAADSPSAADAAPSAEADASHFRQVFDEFMATRKECGEQGGLSYEKFAVRLQQSQDAVIAKHGCTSVNFHVYVKNGKAALRATPAR